MTSVVGEVENDMLSKMYPELHVSDVGQSASFFEDALGFTVTDQFEDEGVVDFAVLQNGDLMIYLPHMLPEREADRRKPVRLFFEPIDIHETHAQLRAKGLSVTDLEDQDYGAGPSLAG